MDKQKFAKWTFGFSAKALKVITVMWAASMTFGAFIITLALVMTGSIEEPVNYIAEINRTFAASVVAILITRTVGNVFEHNNGSIFGTSIEEKPTTTTFTSGYIHVEGDDDGSPEDPETTTYTYSNHEEEVEDE